MTRLILWWFTASTRYSYLFVRAVLRLPLLLLPISSRVRNQVAGALAIALWFFLLLILVVLPGAPWWGQLMVAATSVLVIVGVVRMEGRRSIIRRTVRAQ